MVENASLFFVMYIAAWLLGVIITLWILWAIIRGAVLSALRAHGRETREAALREPSF